MSDMEAEVIEKLTAKKIKMTCDSVSAAIDRCIVEDGYETWKKTLYGLHLVPGMFQEAIDENAKLRARLKVAEESLRKANKTSMTDAEVLKRAAEIVDRGAKHED